MTYKEQYRQSLFGDAHVAPGAHIYAASNGTQGRNTASAEATPVEAPIDPALTVVEDKGGGQELIDGDTPVLETEGTEHIEEGPALASALPLVCFTLIHVFFY